MSALTHGYVGPAWAKGYKTEWSIVVGDRIRRLRRARGMTLLQLATAVVKPDGNHYSGGYFSRLERGWASPPLYAYVMAAEVLGVDPGRVLGSDEAQKPITEAEMTLVRFMRRIGVSPDEAIALIARHRSGA